MAVEIRLAHAELTFGTVCSWQNGCLPVFSKFFSLFSFNCFSFAHLIDWKFGGSKATVTKGERESPFVRIEPFRPMLGDG